VKVGLYARVSTERQQERGTVGSQLAALRAAAAAEGHEVIEEFVDDGYSGARLDRPALDRLRDAAEAGVLDGVLCLCVDRLARAYAYQVLILEELERFGVAIHFLEGPMPSDDPQATLLIQMQGVIAEYGKRRTTGMRKGMKESYVEDLASHGGPGHALATREGAAKRWFQGVRRPAIEPRNAFDWGADAVVFSEGNTAGGVIASRQWAPRGLRPRHACDLFMPRTGRAHGRPPLVMVGRAARGRLRP
jgi:hypothetical protein